MKRRFKKSYPISAQCCISYSNQSLDFLFFISNATLVWNRFRTPLRGIYKILLRLLTEEKNLRKNLFVPHTELGAKLLESKYFSFTPWFPKLYKKQLVNKLLP